jgi:hypothetical protein
MTFDYSKLIKSTIEVLRENPQLRNEILDSFSRVKTSFYPSLFSKYHNLQYESKNNDHYTQAISLFRFIERDTDLQNKLVNVEIDEIEKNNSSNSNLQDILVDISKSEIVFKQKCSDKKAIDLGLSENKVSLNLKFMKF